jgi:hypothetical protein
MARTAAVDRERRKEDRARSEFLRGDGGATIIAGMVERRSSPGERRTARRAPFVAAVRRDDQREIALALSQDLGVLGMKLRCPHDEPAPLGGAMTLSFELPDGGELLRVRGSVVFARVEGAYQTTGVRFHSLSSRDTRRILEFLAAA